MSKMRWRLGINIIIKIIFFLMSQKLSSCCLAETPKLLVIGPGRPPVPAYNDLVNENGILKWELFTRKIMWGI